MDPLKTDEEQSVEKHLSRPPAPFLSLQTVAKILEVIQPPGSHLNSFGGLGLNAFCQGHAVLFIVPFTLGSPFLGFCLFVRSPPPPPLISY